MRLFLAFLLIGCGGPPAPAFVPVTFMLSDAFGDNYLFATATKKLNPSCSSNCEMGTAIEDGGCASVTVKTNLDRTVTTTCEGTGGVYLAIAQSRDGGQTVMQPRLIAVGAEIEPYVPPVPGTADDPSCRGKFTVQTAVSIAAVRGSTRACTFAATP